MQVVWCCCPSFYLQVPVWLKDPCTSVIEPCTWFDTIYPDHFLFCFGSCWIYSCGFLTGETRDGFVAAFVYLCVFFFQPALLAFLFSRLQGLTYQLCPKPYSYSAADIDTTKVVNTGCCVRKSKSPSSAQKSNQLICSRFPRWKVEQRLRSWMRSGEKNSPGTLSSKEHIMKTSINSQGWIRIHNT